MGRSQLEEWNRKIEAWQKKYGAPDPLDLSSVLARRPCEKCGKSTGKLHRHHVGNDLLWAVFHEEIFAPRYVQFHPDDIVILCQRCHEKIHRRYERKILDKYAHDWFYLGMIPSVKLCKELQTRCREECEKWLNAKTLLRSQHKSTSGRQKKSSRTK